MCARIIQNVDVHALGRVYRVQTDNTDPQIPIRWNGPPGERYHLCAAENGVRSLRRMRWGLTPAWSAKADFAPHNARCETAATKPTFRQAWKQRRAVLPVHGWYEWRKRDGTPFLIADAAGGILHLAALWERRNGRAGAIDGFAVLTTAPRREIAPIHHRQPSVLNDPAAIDEWLDPGTPEARLRALARGSGDAPLRVHEVSRAVNHCRNDDESVARPARLL